MYEITQKKVVQILLAFAKQEEMFPTDYTIEISLINPMIQSLSQQSQENYISTWLVLHSHSQLPNPITLI